MTNLIIPVILGTARPGRRCEPVAEHRVTGSQWRVSGPKSGAHVRSTV